MKEVKLIFNGGYQFSLNGEFNPEDLEALSKAFKVKYRYTVDTVCIDFSQVACMIFNDIDQKVTELKD